MTYRMYTNILSELVKKSQYESISNIYGNSMAGDEARESIQTANPFSDLFGSSSSGGAQHITRADLEALQGIKRV